VTMRDTILMVERPVEDMKSIADRLTEYVEKGRVVSTVVEDMEPIMAVELNIKNLKPLKVMSSTNHVFTAVDCSTIPLVSAHNFGVYVLRVSSTTITPKKEVKTSFKEYISDIMGDKFLRRYVLETERLEHESSMALSLLPQLNEDDYLLLDGPSLFGRTRRFSIDLYYLAQKHHINLLTLSKTTTAMTMKGTDFISSLLVEDMNRAWLYHPYLKAKERDRHMYGDISFVRLNPEVPIAFRCDIMEYLTGKELVDLISPLTFLAQDARCLGYPVALYIAHQETEVASPKLLYYRDQLEGMLPKHVLHRILLEEKVAGFRREMYGVRNVWDWASEQP